VLFGEESLKNYLWLSLVLVYNDLLKFLPLRLVMLGRLLALADALRLGKDGGNFAILGMDWSCSSTSVKSYVIL
jgi:hypothetical protein